MDESQHILVKAVSEGSVRRRAHFSSNHPDTPVNPVIIYDHPKKIPGLFLFDNDKGAVEGYLYYHSEWDDSFTTLHMLE